MSKKNSKNKKNKVEKKDDCVKEDFGEVLRFSLMLSNDKKISIDKPNLEVVLSQTAYSQVVGYLTSTNCEVSCFGTLDIKDDGTILYVEELFLPEQVGQSAETNVCVQSLAKLVTELTQNNRSDKIDKLKVWFHSHPNMTAYFSTIDTREAIPAMLRSHLLSIVINEKLDMKARLDIAKPIRLGIEDIPILLENTVNFDLADKCRDELGSKVKKVHHVSKISNYSNTISYFPNNTVSTYEKLSNKFKNEEKDQSENFDQKHLYKGMTERHVYIWNIQMSKFAMTKDGEAPVGEVQYTKELGSGEYLIVFTSGKGLISTISGYQLAVRGHEVIAFNRWLSEEDNKNKKFGVFVAEYYRDDEKDIPLDVPSLDSDFNSDAEIIYTEYDEDRKEKITVFNDNQVIITLKNGVVATTKPKILGEYTMWKRDNKGDFTDFQKELGDFDK